MNLPKKYFNECLFQLTIWMYIWLWLYSCTINKKINRLHERCLRIIYGKQSSFEKLLEKDGFVSTHKRSIQILAT